MAGTSRAGWNVMLRLLVWGGLVAVLLLGGAWMTVMPGTSAKEPLAEPTGPERALAERLEADVRALADEIGERNMHLEGSLPKAAAWVESRMDEAGYRPERHRYELRGARFSGYAGKTADNLIAELPGTTRPGEIVIVGAHYDTVRGSPGANDNASGVAALLALAEWFSERPQPRTVRFVSFVNEEPPFFTTRDMGSHAYAARSREQGEQIVAMMSLDGLGYFSNEPRSQRYPVPGIGLAYPGEANFIGFVTRLRDRGLLHSALAAFREQASVPSEGAALPAVLPGVGWSDHWSFWQHGFSAFMVTDTLPFRYPHYHSARDRPEHLDYERMARVTEGLKAVVEHLAGA